MTQENIIMEQYSDLAMSTMTLLMATNKNNMNKQSNPYENVKLEEIIKRDDFISVTNENPFAPCEGGVSVHSYYKVKMKSRKEPDGRCTPYQSWRYYDMFDRQVQHPEYWFYISKPLTTSFIDYYGTPVSIGQKYWFVRNDDYVVASFIAVRVEYDELKNGLRFATEEAANKYIYENKKVYTKKELEDKCEEAYKSGMDSEFVNRMTMKKSKDQERIDSERFSRIMNKPLPTNKFNYTASIDPWKI